MEYSRGDVVEFKVGSPLPLEVRILCFPPCPLSYSTPNGTW